MPVEEKSTEGDNLWMKAAVVGGLWAALEIIVGSFLHNTRLPFAGSILAFAGTVLLIGFYRMWPERGLIIRAGLITAIMKSVSPSAVILGPMTGIMLEAVLIELMILLLGSNLFGFLIAGIFSVSSALLHKFVSLIIVYGFDLITIYINMVNFALKQFGLKEAEPVQILVALLIVYALFGILAAILGFYIGKKAIRMKKEYGDLKEGSFPEQPKEFFEIRQGQKTSLGWLVVHILAIPVGLFMVNMSYRLYGFVFMGIYILLTGYRYRYSLRRLKKPVFWSQLFIIVILSALFWDVGEGFHHWFSTKGVLTGFEMVLRALFIVVAFTAISVELLNEKVRHFLFHVGFGKFYQSVGMAFSALPAMISVLPKSQEIIRHPLKSFLKPLAMADQWLEMFRNE
ncbi:MAG: hypothetical protein DRI88_02365 [Bacteroidetes bacterium]|nr:MAG: hypothetical protein DRI88_02365 [Bacteroidota bacterium]RLD73285.1 MAG: hypothetical protein DRI87_04345 [Bacteroidota bacterium]RLD87436.1 MAG: hypothetical protein DRJ02_06365 [Bacteroidota bacterium]